MQNHLFHLKIITLLKLVIRSYFQTKFFSLLKIKNNPCIFIETSVYSKSDMQAHMQAHIIFEKMVKTMIV